MFEQEQKQCAIPSMVLAMCVTVFLALIVSVPSMAHTYEYSFRDTDHNAWYMVDGWVPYVSDADLMQGYAGTNLFGPNDQIERAQVVTILYRYASDDASDTIQPSNYATENTTGLIDVEPNRYYTAAVNWAYKNHIITGYSETQTLEPYQPILRQELAAILFRFADYCGAKGHINYAALDGLLGAEDVDTYARDGVAWCTTRGIITGISDQFIAPYGYATRAQMAKMMTVFVKYTIEDDIIYIPKQNGIKPVANIIQDYRVGFFHGVKSAVYQKYIMIHDTEGDSNPWSVIDWWDSNGSYVAAHFVIGKDGSIVQCVPLGQIAHHAGFGNRGHNALYGVFEDGRDDLRGTIGIGDYFSDYGMNAYSIGIELVHVGGSGDYPKAQLEALDSLINYIDAYYGFDSKIIDHKAWRLGNSDTSPEFAGYLANYQAVRSYKAFSY